MRVTILLFLFLANCVYAQSYFLIQRTGNKAQRKIWLHIQEYTIETRDTTFRKHKIKNINDSTLWISYTRIYTDTITKKNKEGQPEKYNSTFGTPDSLALRLHNIIAIRKGRLRRDVTASAGFMSIMGLISFPLAAIAGGLDASSAAVLGGLTIVSAGVCLFGMQEKRFDLTRKWTIEKKIRIHH